MKNLIPILLVLFVIVLGCGTVTKTDNTLGTSTPTPTTSTTPTSQPTSTPISTEAAARYLVGKDQELNRPADIDDIHVRRVNYLLTELISLTKEDLNQIAGATDATSDYLAKDYGRKIPREKLLEDMKAFYSDKSLKIKLKYKEVITAQAMIEYAN